MLTINSLYHQHRPWMFYLTELRAYLFSCSKHPVSVPRWGLLNSPRKISNFQKFFEVRPRSKFPTGEKTKPIGEKTKPTGEKTKPTGDNLRILRGEAHKQTVLILQKIHTHMLIYIHIHTRLTKNTKVAWQHY